MALQELSRKEMANLTTEASEAEPPEPPEPGALFIRASANKTEPLTCFQAEAIEALLMLMAAGDWKETFITGILLEFRRGSREAPADVLWDLEQAADQFETDIDTARQLARDYAPLLNTAAPACETRLFVGSGSNKPAAAPIEQSVRKAAPAVGPAKKSAERGARKLHGGRK